MNEVVELSGPYYQLNLVVFSYVISVAGSFLALTSARKIRNSRNEISAINLLVASTALGGMGVWAMHFTGMLALNLGMGSAYSVLETVLSLVASMGATAVAFTYVSKDASSGVRVLLGGVFLGLGITVMHYLGMSGMRFPGYIEWSWLFIVLSVIIAIIAASVALWLAFRTKSLVLRWTASGIMGVAVCSMHYTGMAAAEFVCTALPVDRFAIPKGFMIVSAIDLPMLTAGVSIGILVLIAYEQALQRIFSNKTVK